jgi:hypothetical protein
MLYNIWLIKNRPGTARFLQLKRSLNTSYWCPMLITEHKISIGSKLCPERSFISFLLVFMATMSSHRHCTSMRRFCAGLTLLSADQMQELWSTWCLMICWSECGPECETACHLRTPQRPCWRSLWIMLPTFMICMLRSTRGNIWRVSVSEFFFWLFLSCCGTLLPQR